MIERVFRNPRSGSGIMRLASRGLLAALGAAAMLSPASAQSAWTAADFEARITLPAPLPGSPVTAATMSCAEQVWTLVLSLEPEAVVEGADGTVTLAVPRETFQAPSKALPAGIEIVVPSRALEPIRAATRLSITFAGGTEVGFSLTGSRRAINAAEALCTERIMPLANSIPLTPFSSYLPLAGELRRDDIADFKLSTNSEPRQRAGMVEIGDGRRLLFSELCGSNWYYGVSGCSLSGYAPVAGSEADEPEGWRLVYESEGAFLYVDPDTASDGWPDLIAMSAKPGGVDLRWRWDGEAYALAEAVEPGDLATADSD